MQYRGGGPGGTGESKTMRVDYESRISRAIDDSWAIRGLPQRAGYLKRWTLKQSCSKLRIRPSRSKTRRIAGVRRMAFKCAGEAVIGSIITLGNPGQ